ncbi:MAG TPA: class I SAM-dependent methyltransferase [Actinomycetota bacterium]|nr:class I SAM-dependent methyltransferase [Actinomycetota bacterium]
MPPGEGLALYEAALAAPPGPFLEIGSYCGKSAIYLGAAAAENGTILYTVDHHRGSEEHQPGEEYHDPALTDAAGRVDTFPELRRTLERAGLTDVVVSIVAPSPVVARGWATPLAFLFVDGGHSPAAADADYASWSPHVVPDGLLAIHDVFEDPAEGGRPPFEIYRRAIESASFAEVSRTGSLRVLKRVG